ncbi:MAG: SufE family protein [Candidatus Azobacteroides sp.]|nr:SufE family protein [Candidatus Azobacteroides sp.]
MNLNESQKQAIAELSVFDTWTDKFDYLIELGESMPGDLPGSISRNSRIEGCLSRSYFNAFVIDGYIRTEGWSNSNIVAGIIVLVSRIFNGISVRDLRDANIYFHIDSGLSENLTYRRKMLLDEIIRRIIVLSEI